MNQWETGAVGEGLALFAMLFIMFLFTRKRWVRSVFLPQTLLALNIAWLLSAIVCSSAEKFALLQGLPFGMAYSFIIFVSPLVIAAGLLEGVVVVYSVMTIKTGWPTLALRRHTHAYLSAALCFFVYLFARSLITKLR